MRRALCLAFASAFMMYGAAAHAGEIVEISGTGTWDAVPVTPESAPNESFSFSFDLPSPGTNPTSAITGFSYALGGSPVSTTLSGVKFYPAIEMGMFDLDFADGYRLSFYGADVGSTGTIATGVFPATFQIKNGCCESNTATGAVVTIAAVPDAVPEPASLALFAAGLLSLAVGWGGIGRIRRSRN